MDKFPTWAYGPGGQADIFHREEDIPAGWVDHPSKVEDKAAKPAKAPEPAKQPAKAPEPAKTAETPPTGDAAELDAHGHPYDPALHAATRSKTKDGLWRLKVGASRPAPAPGYPKPAQPLDL